MRYDEITPTLTTIDKLTDGDVVARGDYDPKTREITLKGKGAPREWRGNDIVTTDKMVAFSRDQYVTDGTVIVVGRVKAPTAPKASTANVARVAESGRDPKPKTKRGGRTCNDCGANLSPNPKAQHTCKVDANVVVDALATSMTTESNVIDSLDLLSRDALVRVIRAAAVRLA